MLKELTKTFLNKDASQDIIDFAFDGGLDRRGNINKSSGVDALNNAIVLWLNSQRGDFYGNPNKGGWAVRYLTKGLSEEVGDQLRVSILQGLEQDFGIDVVVNSIELNPNHAKRRWELNMQLTSPSLMMTTKVETFLEAQ